MISTAALYALQAGVGVWRRSAIANLGCLVRMADALEMSVAKEVPFNTLCLLMEKISDAKGKEKKKGMFAKFLEHWKITHKKIHGDKVIKVNNLLRVNSMQTGRRRYSTEQV